MCGHTWLGRRWVLRQTWHDTSPAVMRMGLDVQLDMGLEVGGGLDASSSLSIMSDCTLNPTSSQTSTTPPTTSGHTSITSITSITTITSSTTNTTNTSITTNTTNITITSNPTQPVEVI